MKRAFVTLLLLLACAAPSLAWAQVPAPAQQPAAAASQTPPPPAPGGPPVLRAMELRFHPDNAPMVDTLTYLYYIKSRPILNDQWQPYNETELLADYRRLWATNFLDNLWIEVLDEPFDNGAPAKHVIFHFEER